MASLPAAPTGFGRLIELTPTGPAPLLRDGAGAVRLSYDGARRLAVRAASRLRQAGVGASDRLAALVPNGCEAAGVALVLPGLCQLAPLSCSLTEPELLWQLADLPAAGLLIARWGGQTARHQAAAARAGVPVLWLTQEPDERLFDISPARPGCPAAGCGDELAESDPDETAMLLYTSGTTARPKLVPLSGRNLATAAFWIGRTLGLAAGDVCLNTMPLYHLHGIAANLLATALAGGSVVCADGLGEPGRFFALAEAAGVTWYSAAPSIHQAIVEYHERLQSNGSDSPAVPLPRLRLARSCSAALLPSVEARMRAMFGPGCVVLATYAMTECIPICSNPVAGERKPGSVGPAAGPAVRIVDELDRPVAAGCEGQVVVSGPCAMRGYEPRPWLELDEYLTSDGWIRTGDKGMLDSDGYLFLTGRSKEMINRSGEKISPLAVEEPLSRHPAVLECVCFAAPHTQLGEVVAVAAVLRAGSERPSLSELCEACVGCIEPKWSPELLVWIPKIPVGRTGKPSRIGLAQLLGLDALSFAPAPREWQAVAPSFEDDDRPEARWVLSAVVSASSQEPGSILEQCRTVAERVLVRRCAEPDVPLVQVGMDSITATALSSQLAARFCLDLPGGFALSAGTLANMAALIQIELAKAPMCSWHEHSREGFVPHGRAKPAKIASERGAPGELAAWSKAERRAAHEQRTRHVQSADEEGTGLWLARYGELERLEQAVGNGFDPEVAVDKHGLTALQWAAGEGQLGVVSFLLQHRVSPDARNKEGRTALMWACRNGHLEVARLLVEYGADPRATSKKGVGCLHWACWGNATTVADWLLDEQRLELEMLSNAGCNSAIWAVTAGELEICKMLQARGANFGHVNSWGHGVVAKVAYRGHNALLSWLLDQFGLWRQLFHFNHMNQLPVDLAREAGHDQTVCLIHQAMAEHPDEPTGPALQAPAEHVHEHKRLSMATDPQQTANKSAH